jgi:NAD(P)-dependent dehydrogenase (short-subunit alcohol dehydrogenase family)
MVWVGSSSTRGGTPTFLAPYFAAKAAMDALAVSYSTELALWGIETTIMVPGAAVHLAATVRCADGVAWLEQRERRKRRRKERRCRSYSWPSPRRPALRPLRTWRRGRVPKKQSRQTHQLETR